MLRQGFIHGALVLALASITSRILGVFYVALLPRLLTGEGYGLYTAVKPLYHAVMIVAVAGFPVAIAKMVAERLAVGDVREVRRIYVVSLLFTFCSGLAASLLLVAGSGLFASVVLKMPEASITLLAVAPSVFLCTLASALRGYFQGLQQMTPSAVSQIAEQLARVAGTIGFALFLIPLGSVYGAAGALAGSITGGLAALVVLVFYYIKRRRAIRAELEQRNRAHRHPQRRDTLRRLVELSFPVVLGQILWPVFELIDSAFIPHCLQIAGYSQGESLAWLGYFGMAGQLMWFPTVITLAFSTSLVPAISAAWAQRSKRLIKKRLGEALRVVMMFSLPASVGLFALANQCAWLLFGYMEAGVPLRILAFGTLVIGLQQITSGTLQGMGQMLLPVRNLLCGVVIKLACNYWLVPMPYFGIRGAAWGTLVGFSVAACLNMRHIYQRTGFPVGQLGQLKATLLCTSIMYAIVHAAYALMCLLLQSLLPVHFISAFWVNAVATITAVAVGTLAYAAMTLRFGGWQRHDIEALPWVGRKLALKLTHLGWLV